MRTAIVTGGAGFLGRLLNTRLLEDGWRVLSIDLQPLEMSHPRLVARQGDIRNAADLEALAALGPVDAIFHCAAQLAHGSVGKQLLWSCNVEGTKQVAAFARRFKVPKVVYTSSNCLWGESLRRPVTEDDEPKPIEPYGLTKWEGEKALLAHADAFDTVVLRCPTIIDAGRLGLLAILFEFIDEGRRVWVVGDGSNRYQFIYAQDLIDGMLLASRHNGSAILGIGSDQPGSMREVYGHVIEKAGSSSRVASLPKGPTIMAMKLAYHLGVSPLGPYHYKMIAEDFTFDTTRIKNVLGWKPTLTNAQMLHKAYEYYRKNRVEIHGRDAASAHRKATSMGVIRVLKWMS
jgi:UDP-glucose 4-epimerase